MIRRALLIASLAALSGCAGLDAIQNAYQGIQDYFTGKDNAEPPEPLAEITPQVRADKLWTADIGDGYDEQSINLGPAVDDSRVFAAERHGTVLAFNRLTGDKLWSVDHEMELSAGPVFDDGELFLATAEGAIIVLNAADGALVWKSTLASEILSVPAVADDVVVVRGANGHLTGLDRKSGATRWYFERHAPPLAIRSRGAPIIAGDLVIDGFGGGKVSAIQLKEGKLDWEANVSLPHGRSEIERLVDLSATPVVRSDSVFVSGYQGGTASLGLNTGEVLWKRESISSPAGMTADRKELYVTDANADLWQLAVRNGEDQWKQAELHQRRLTAPALVKDYLVVGDFEGYLHVLNKEDGRIVGRVQITDEPIEYPPVVYGDIVYVYATDGTLAAVTVE
ncbi:outer membrane protein assembly factor BamB [Methylococcus mesophilus]|uniref:outer membrane protein assembly factor BamB n=1 Tax=Methylococcus mesophilus TaxID=2993564 RepID=UPI00224B31C5|nr:outer membrane protein assembly factor BamB [Methylococcus mesophilus]UZR27805.1 outer membrane protein assembly factor BamB [Methylococcus mesophilus]